MREEENLERCPVFPGQGAGCYPEMSAKWKVKSSDEIWAEAWLWGRLEKREVCIWCGGGCRVSRSLAGPVYMFFCLTRINLFLAWRYWSQWSYTKGKFGLFLLIDVCYKSRFSNWCSHWRQTNKIMTKGRKCEWKATELMSPRRILIATSDFWETALGKVKVVRKTKCFWLSGITWGDADTKQELETAALHRCLGMWFECSSAVKIIES